MTSSLDSYRSVDVSTAPPRALIQRAYDAAIASLEEAETALARGEPFADPLRKAQTIVGGLMTALDFQAGELAERFLRLYLFTIDRMHRTAMDRADRGLGEARRVLVSLREGWTAMPALEASIAAPKPRAGLQFRG